MRVLIVLALAITSASAGIVPRHIPASFSFGGRITNGTNASEGQIPYQVLLLCSSLIQSWYCGGSLISSSSVLTAGHCGFGAVSCKVYAGSTSLQNITLVDTVSVLNIRVHLGYRPIPNLKDDIACLNIKNLDTSSTINTVPLPPPSWANETFVGEKGNASGWGLQSDNSTSLANPLQVATLPVISNTDCARFYSTAVVKPGVLCTASPYNTSTCSGDSGGPFVHNGILLGITSFGSSAGCEKGYPAGFTRVPYYLDWIKRNCL